MRYFTVKSDILRVTFIVVKVLIGSIISVFKAALLGGKGEDFA